MSSLTSMTEERIARALEKVTLTSIGANGKLQRVTEEHYSAALDILRNSYSSDEPLSRSAGMKWGPDAEETWIKVLQQKLSLIIINVETEQVLAFLGVQIVGPENSFPTERIQDKGMKIAWEFAKWCDLKANVLEHYGVEEAVHLLGLAVVPQERKKGLGSAIVHAAIELVKNLEAESVCIKIECSSNFSKKIAEKEGFDIVCEFPFEEYQVNEEPIFKNTGEHRSMKMYGMRI